MLLLNFFYFKTEDSLYNNHLNNTFYPSVIERIYLVLKINCLKYIFKVGRLSASQREIKVWGYKKTSANLSSKNKEYMIM